VGNGNYYRNAYDEEGNLIEDLPIKRYKCRRNERLKKVPVTFSLLLSALSPYRKYSLGIQACFAAVWVKCKGKTKQVLEEICRMAEVTEELVNIEASNVDEIIKVFRNAFIKYRLWQKKADYSLEEFIGNCSGLGDRGAERLAIEYYSAHGGYLMNSQFLFGKASQFRTSKKGRRSYQNDS